MHYIQTYNVILNLDLLARILTLKKLTMISYLLFLSLNFILVITVLYCIHIEFNSRGFIILMFSFNITFMKENLMQEKFL